MKIPTLTMKLSAIAGALVFGLCGTQQAHATSVKVTVTSLAPSMGVEFTPVWVGFHDGGFDTYNLGQAASPALERLAEDGNPGPIVDSFAAAGYANQGVIFSPGGVLPPIFEAGESNSMIFELDGTDANNRYFSLLSMIVPSNDAFFGNDNAMGHRIFNDDGTFKGDLITVFGAGVRDAGTEVNDEIASNTARLGQMSPNTGVTENGVVGKHAGFLADGSILSAFPNADFTQPDYRIARIEISRVPEPGPISLIALGLGAIAWTARRRKNNITIPV